MPRWVSVLRYHLVPLDGDTAKEKLMMANDKEGSGVIGKRHNVHLVYRESGAPGGNEGKTGCKRLFTRGATVDTECKKKINDE